MRTWAEPKAELALDELLHDVRIRQRALGVLFRHHWYDIAHAPLPVDMLALLERLDERKQERVSTLVPSGRGPG